jgi:hypothetical protein
MKAKERRAAADFLSDNLRALEDRRGRERVSSGKEWVQGSTKPIPPEIRGGNMELFSPSASSEMRMRYI